MQHERGMRLKGSVIMLCVESESVLLLMALAPSSYSSIRKSPAICKLRNDLLLAGLTSSANWARALMAKYNLESTKRPGKR